MSQYDYLVVGAGLSGAVFANAAKRAGKSVLVIDRRDHIAGREPPVGVRRFAVYQQRSLPLQALDQRGGHTHLLPKEGQQGAGGADGGGEIHKGAPFKG